MKTIEDDAERIVRFSAFKLILFFLPVALLATLSVAIDPQAWRKEPHWPACVLVAAVAFLVYGCLVWPRTFYLRLTPEGLFIHRGMSEQHYHWSEVYDFRVVDGPGRTGIRIVWNLTNESPHRTALIIAAHSVLGHDGSLLNTFAIPADELVALLNTWQQASSETSTGVITVTHADGMNPGDVNRG